MKEFISNNLITIHSGGIGGKLWASFQLAAVPAVGLSISERFTGWYIDSQMFIIILIALLFADLFIGIWKHWKLRSFSFKKMLYGLCEKIAMTIVFYFLSEVIIQIIADAKLDSIYVKVAFKLIMFFYLGGNALVNMGIISNGKIPPVFFLKGIAKFNETGDIKLFNFKENQDESEDTDNNPTE